MPDNFIPAIGAERGQRVAHNIGGGIASGLNALLEHKAKTMRLENIGIAPEHAAYIASLPPKEQFEAVRIYQRPGQGQGTQGMPQGQGMQGAQGPQMGGTPPGQGQQQGFQNHFGGAQTPAQLKHADALTAGQQNLEDIISTTDRMRKTLQSKKVGSGVISTIGAKFAPNWLGKETELFDKDSAHVVNLTSADLKGVPSVFRVKLIEKEKPGVQHSYAVNEQILDRLNRDARAKLKTLQRRNPWLAQYGNEEGVAQGYQPEQGGEFAPGETEQQYEQQQAPEESILGTLARGGVRTAARVGEAIAGTPGDILGAGAGLANYVTGGSFPSYGQIQEKLPVSFPTSEQLKEFTGNATRGYTNPQGGLEEGIDSAVQTFASLFLPSKLKPSVVSNLSKVLSPTATKIASNVILPFSGVSAGKALAMTAAGEAAEGLTGAVGGGPIAKAGAKLVAMSLAGTAGGKHALENKMQASYDAAQSALGTQRNVKNTVKSGPITRKLETLQRDLKKVSIPNKDLVKSILDENVDGLKASLRSTQSNKAIKGRIPVNDLIEKKKALNQWLALGYEQRVAGDKFLGKDARIWVDKIADVYRENLAKYGKSNPKFGEPFVLAEDIFKGLKDTQNVNQFVAKLGSPMGFGLKSYVAKQLLINGILKPATKAGASVISGVITNDTIRKHYSDLLKAAAQNSVPEFKRVLAKLDKEAYRIEKKRGY